MRRGARIGIGAGVIAALLAAGAGLWEAFADEGHPFGDAWACEGSAVPLPTVDFAVGLPQGYDTVPDTTDVLLTVTGDTR
nr:hypothetical protein OG999_29155 [Streptomyces sp. NBC_00886]